MLSLCPSSANRTTRTRLSRSAGLEQTKVRTGTSKRNSFLKDENPHDSMAVRVDINGTTVGYLSRDHARTYRRGLSKAGYGTANAYCEALIRGGWDRGEGDRGFYGVYLDLFFVQ